MRLVMGVRNGKTVRLPIFRQAQDESVAGLRRHIEWRRSGFPPGDVRRLRRDVTWRRPPSLRGMFGACVVTLSHDGHRTLFRHFFVTFLISLIFRPPNFPRGA